MKLKILAFAVALTLAAILFTPSVRAQNYNYAPGTVVAWGNNSYGGNTEPADLSGVVAIAAGGIDYSAGRPIGHALALKQDGTVVAWGDGETNISNDPNNIADFGQSIVPSGLNGVIAVAAGGDYSLVLKSNGMVVAWGENLYGQTNVPAGLNSVVAIAAGEDHSLALKNNGIVSAWGLNDFGQTSVPIGLSNVIAIADGAGFALALKRNGTVTAWGSDQFGATEVPTGLTNVIAISAGASHGLALKSDGTITAWGFNGDGQCTVPSGLSNVVAIAAGWNHSLALKSDGTVKAWGLNTSGQGTTPNGLSNVVAIAAGGDQNLALVATPNQSPNIFGQPISRTVQASSNVTFTLFIAGSSPLNYQWQFNGQNIAGQTATSLSLTNVQFANAGGYSVVVTNAYGSVTSAVAQLTVYTNMVLTQTNRAPTTNEIGKPTIPTDPNHFKVYTNGNFQSGIALNPNKMTVVLTHGWNGSPGDWAAYTAQIIQRRIGSNVVNIVAWDWTADARQPDFLHLTDIAAKTPGEGVALGTNLIAAVGANYTQRIHFVGHSLGTLVNAAAANYVHGHGFSWANTQMTLCDEAEIASGVGANGLWQFTTTLPQTGVRLIQNASTTEPYWGQALPNKFAWADNYISACGLLHPEAANAILNYTYPGPVGDMSTFLQEFYNFHDYAHYFYEDTIEPGIFNTGGQINATYMGFICSFEGGGIAQRPAANMVFYQNPNGLELNLAQTDWTSATSLLNARLNNFLGASVSSGINVALDTAGNAVGQVNGQIVSAGQNLENMVLNFFTSVSGGSLIQTSGVHPLGGPVPLGGSAGNTPAYAWIPLTIPSNAVSMSFDFMLQGNGNQDSFQAALQGTNILSLETSLIQTNVILNSGLINVSQYAGTNVELFLGIVGGTSTNAQLTVSDIQFYSVALPSLQAQASGSNLMLSWPLSAQNFSLQTTTNLADPNSWMTLTNVPAIVNLQNAVTNPASDGARYYRLKQ